MNNKSFLLLRFLFSIAGIRDLRELEESYNVFSRNVLFVYEIPLVSACCRIGGEAVGYRLKAEGGNYEL